MKDNNILPQESYGFREGVGINEYIVRLVNILENNKSKKYQSAVITIDIAKAFDKVNSNILLRQLKEIKVDDKYIYWISQCIRNRELNLEVNNLTEHKIISEGVPQGDVLSPILFNIYTKNLHTIKSEHTEVLQYADDFTFIVRAKQINILNDNCNDLIKIIKLELGKLNFDINIDKCNFMTLNHMHTNRMQLSLNGNNIKQSDSLKILGVTIDKQLNFKKHFRETKDTTTKSLNTLKIFNSKRGGAHPKSMLNVHNALIKSRTMYAAAGTLTRSSVNNKKIQTLHNTSLRHCLGLTKTTPITAVLGEAAEWPIEYIKQIYSIKFIAKHLSRNSNIGQDIKNNCCTKQLNSIYNEFTILKDIPVTIKRDIIFNNITINCDIANYTNKLTNLEKKYHALNTIANYANKYHIYTDGSKCTEGVGIGIFFDDTKEEINKFINLDLSIKTAETIAIYLSLKMAISMQKDNIVIFTDSKSSCMSIKNNIKLSKNNYYEQQIIELANLNPNIQIFLQWIPAHVGVPGNEVADKLASKKINITNIIPEKIKIPSADAINICKKIIHNKWTEQFKTITQFKGIYHANIISQPTHEPWFKKTQLNSAQIKQITRLRTGHTYDKKHHYIMKLTDSNLCSSCNIIENHEHIINHCTQHEHTRQKYSDIKTRGLSDILQRGPDSALASITSFLNDIKVKL